MRLRELAKRVEQLAQQSEGGAGGPVGQHVITTEDLALHPSSRLAPVFVDDMPVAPGIYQFAAVIDWNAPDQGDGNPPSIYMHMNGIECVFQGQASPVLMYQGNLGPQQVVVSDLLYVPEGGTLSVLVHSESSAVADTNAPEVVLNRLIVSLLG
jgi:hypothetical protein